MTRSFALALALSSCLFATACTLAPGILEEDPEAANVAAAAASLEGLSTATATAAATSAPALRLPPATPLPFPLPTPPPPFTIESYAPATGQLRWPSNISHLQVLLQRGNGTNVYTGAPLYFRAYFIGNGKHMLRALSVRFTDYDEFRAQLTEVLETRGAPNDKATWGIAGSLWNGPQPGPIGDGLTPTHVTRLVRSAAALEDAADLSSNFAEN
jgi:hypothetical protein